MASTVIDVLNEHDRIIKKILTFAQSGAKVLDLMVKELAADTQEAIVDKITSDVRPHQRRGETVTDLVDTGAYRRSFLLGSDGSGRAHVSTNIEYALDLEYGNAQYRGFFVVRDTVGKIRQRLPEYSGRALKRVNG